MDKTAVGATITGPIITLRNFEAQALTPTIAAIIQITRGFRINIERLRLGLDQGRRSHLLG